MSKWLLRGLVFAALMVVIRLLQGALINVFETQALLISIALVVLYAIGALVWGLSDGRGDARVRTRAGVRQAVPFRGLRAPVPAAPCATRKRATG